MPRRAPRPGSRTPDAVPQDPRSATAQARVPDRPDAVCPIAFEAHPLCTDSRTFLRGVSSVLVEALRGANGGTTNPLLSSKPIDYRGQLRCPAGQVRMRGHGREGDSNGRQENSPQGYGPQRYGPQGYGPQAYGPQGPIDGSD